MNKTIFFLLLILFFVGNANAAITVGTNSGFVTERPTTDPGGTKIQIDTISNAFKVVAPADATKITEIGFWYDDFSTSEEANFEVGLYSHNVGDDEPEARLFVETTNAKGTTSGVWKFVTVDWEISEGTTYWLAVEVDDTVTTTWTDNTFSGDNRKSYLTSQTDLPNPWGDGTEFTFKVAVYAIYSDVVIEKTTPLLSGTTLLFVGMLPIGIIVSSLIFMIRRVLPSEGYYVQQEDNGIMPMVVAMASMLFGIVLLVLIIGAFA